MGSDSRDQSEERGGGSERLLQDLLEQSRLQTNLLSDIRVGLDLKTCFLDKIGQIVCTLANETHKNAQLLAAMRGSLAELLELYKSVHPEQALQLDRIAKLQAELRQCCLPDQPVDLICKYEPCERLGGVTPGNGYSVKSKGFIRPVPFNEKPHDSWAIVSRIRHEGEETLPLIPQGPLVGPIVPSPPTPEVLDFRSGSSLPGPQEPVSFRTFTETAIAGIWPPDMSGAKAGEVVLMSGNLWLKLSVDGGKTFKNLDFTKIFAADTTYGGWAGDQVVHYVPGLDCFILYVQSYRKTNKNVVKVAVASPADLIKHNGGKAAWWRHWDFTSDDFALGNRWMDFPDLTHDDKFLYILTNTFADKKFQGKLFFELPLTNLKAGSAFSFYYAFISEEMNFGSPTQNINGENYWAAHVSNSILRIYSSKGAETTYAWRDRTIRNWPMTTTTPPDIVSSAPDSPDWLSVTHQIIGATRVNNELWFAWTADKGDGGAGGFKFPQPHIQIAKFDLNQDYKLVDQAQVWNADHAFAYPSMTTNSDNEIGISLAWGGGKYYGSHAVGILGDFVVWFGKASEKTSSDPRWGDYVHVRLAYPDTRFFSAFGYAVLEDNSTTPSTDNPDYLYVEFGREKLGPPIIK